MKNANKDEQMMENYFNSTGYVVYRKEEDPEQIMLEAMNLADLFGGALTALGQFGLGGRFDAWALRRKVKGFYDFDPFPNWKDRKVIVPARPQWGEGVIKAVKKIGNWYIPGVEFIRSVPNGHFLKFKDAGDMGKPGHCHWIWLDNLEFVYQDQK